MNRIAMVISLAALYMAAAANAAPEAAGVVSGELKKWHRVTITFDGPESSEKADPNPFTDYRLNVQFRKGPRIWAVPGYFAADGNAAETGATSGNKWRVHFTPDEEGEWKFAAYFLQGRDIAVSSNWTAGWPVAFYDAEGSLTVGPVGAGGSFIVGPTDKTGRDFRAKGALRYVGGHYLQFPETGEFFIKGGADSPENFLAYSEFDGTRGGPEAERGKERKGEAAVAASHRYEPHARDWKAGDPTWRGGRGKNIIGALNYLASKGMNSVYFLTMNVGGDGKDVWPWIDDDVRDRFDCSKLDQWEIVFSHMTKLGLMLHIVTQETENDQLLDGGDLGPKRKLYYRELIARFGHHPAITWNLGEENTNTTEQLKEYCGYIRGLRRLVAWGDSGYYDTTFIVVHTFPGQYDAVYKPLLGFNGLKGPSLQMGDFRQTHSETVKWVERSEVVGYPWVVCLDEIGPAHTGVKTDAVDPEHNDVRHHALWGNLMGGGGGAEWYFGYKQAHNDLGCEDWRSRDKMWDQTRYALEFFQNHIPFTVMKPSDSLTESPDDYCLAEPGVVYAIYLPNGGTTKLNLGTARAGYSVQWYNPRTGGGLRRGGVKEIGGPGVVAIGQPPGDPDKDWVALIERLGEVREATLGVNNGSGGGSYAEGAAVNIRAGMPPNGKAFDRWTGNVATIADAAAADTTIVLPPGGTGVTATFKDAPPEARKGAAIDKSIPIKVLKLVLIDADNDKPIAAYDPLKDGSTIALSKLPTRNLSIRAVTEPPVIGSVRFGLDGDDNARTESTAPYSLTGDSAGDYDAWTPKPGSHTITATPYRAAGAVGEKGPSLTLRIAVKD